MIATLRATIKLLVFLIVSVLTVLLVGLGNIVLSIFSIGLKQQWKNVVTGGWAYLISSLLGLEISIRGTAPRPPFFLVTNHLSYIDIILLWMSVDATFVAKSEIKSWPFFGWATKTVGVLFINRELKRDVHRMNKQISSVISDNQGVILFPEGTTTSGDQVKSFNTSLLQYPASVNMPVHYASIRYSTKNPEQPASTAVCWWGDMDFSPHFWKLLQLKKIEGTITFGTKPVQADDRKEMALKLHAKVEGQFLA